jgi:hypothetical protein
MGALLMYFSKLTDQKMQIKASFGGYYRMLMTMLMMVVW